MRNLAILSFLFVSLISFQAHADIERVYIEIPIADLEQTQAEYFKLTGMKIPDQMSLNEAGTHYLTGELKSHFSEAQKTTLQGKVTKLKYSDGWPVGFVKKEAP